MATNEDCLRIDITPLYPVDDYEEAFLILYRQITKRDLERITWRHTDRPTTLRKFLNYMAGPRAAFLVIHEGDVAGLFWLEDIVSGVQCELGGWIPYRYRGLGSEQILRQTLEYTSEKMQFPAVFCHTPWQSARAICRRAGMVEVAALDFYTGAKANKLYSLRWDYAGRRRGE